MPDKVFLRVDARAVGQHDHKDHIVAIHAESGILHAIKAGPVERGNLPVLDAAFCQSFVDVGQFLQISGSGVGVAAEADQAEQQQGQHPAEPGK